MQLTLRTLLAYLDDVLEPEDARVIGAKIAESEIATELIHKLREVLRRRRLLAPDVSGPKMGLDPNLVADYLDNTLAKEKYSEVEKICLDSDIHLAEVAACHQILTLVLSEPVDINPRTREHMYALGPAAPKMASAPASEPVEHPAPVTKSMAKPASETNGVVEPASAPQFAPVKSGGSKRVWLSLLVLVAVGGWIALVMSDFGGKDPKENEEEDPGKKLAKVEPKPEPPKVPENNEPDPKKPVVPPMDLVDPKPMDDPMGTNLLPGEKPPVPPTLPGPMPKTKPKEPGKPVVDNGKPKPTPMEPVKPIPVPPVAEAKLPEDIEYTGDRNIADKGVLLHFDKKKDGWFRLPQLASLKADVRYASPSEFQAELAVGSDLLKLQAQPGLKFHFLPTDKLNAGTHLGLDVHRGRVVFAAEPPVDEFKPIVIFVTVRNHSWKLELLSADTRTGLDVAPTLPSHPGHLFEKDGFSARFATQAGSMRVTGGNLTNPVVVAAGKEITFSPGSQSPTAGAVIVSKELPGWLDPKALMSPAIKTRLKKFAEEFERTRPVAFNIPPLLKETPFIQLQAAKTLAITQNIEGLVTALVRGEPEVCEAAARGLREWLSTGKTRADALGKALRVELSDDDAKIVERVLWGFDAAAARKADPSSDLVQWLVHKERFIRQLAFNQIHKLTGLKHGFNPLWDNPTQLVTGAEKWSDHLDRNKGSLLPQTKPPE